MSALTPPSWLVMTAACVQREAAYCHAVLALPAVAVSIVVVEDPGLRSLACFMQAAAEQ
jgi:hypothetical protein